MDWTLERHTCLGGFEGGSDWIGWTGWLRLATEVDVRYSREWLARLDWWMLWVTGRSAVADVESVGSRWIWSNPARAALAT